MNDREDSDYSSRGTVREKDLFEALELGSVQDLNRDTENGGIPTVDNDLSQARRPG